MTIRVVTEKADVKMARVVLVVLGVQEGCSERSEVRQLQFMAWPDHGVPEYATPLLMFIRRFRSSQPPDAGPIVVHCRYTQLSPV